MEQNAFMHIINALNELKEDNTVPKNIKAKLENMVGLLKENAEGSMKVSRVLHEIEEIAEDVNIQPYTRTQIFNVVSLLEMI